MPETKVTRKIWNDNFYIQIYDLAREGMNNKEISEIINVSYKTLRRWIEEKPALKEALTKARGKKSDKPTGVVSSVQTFMEYVYKQLPEDLKDTWDELQAYEKETNAIRKVELLLHNKGERVRQHLFLHALVCSNFNASEACRRVNITKNTFDGWLLADTGFAELVDQMIWHRKNFFESALVGLVAQGDASATIFANRTMNRDRGYDMKTTVDITGGVLHGHVDLETLNLPVEVLRQLRGAAREKLQAQEPIPLLTNKTDDYED